MYPLMRKILVFAGQLTLSKNTVTAVAAAKTTAKATATHFPISFFLSFSHVQLEQKRSRGRSTKLRNLEGYNSIVVGATWGQFNRTLTLTGRNESLRYQPQAVWLS